MFEKEWASSFQRFLSAAHGSQSCSFGELEHGESLQRPFRLPSSKAAPPLAGDRGKKQVGESGDGSAVVELEVGSWCTHMSKPHVQQHRTLSVSKGLNAVRHAAYTTHAIPKPVYPRTVSEWTSSLSSPSVVFSITPQLHFGARA
eukprot:1659333-Amphidinium_carterae.1